LTVARERMQFRPAPTLMLLRNDLRRFALGLASSPAFVDAPPQSFSATLTKILASRLLTLASIVAGVVAPLNAVGAPGAASPASVGWPTYLGDKGRSLYSPLAQINRSNVAQLEVAWTYDTGDKGEYQANNLIIAGVLYSASPTRKIIALDAGTGRELWKWDPQSERPGAGGGRQRGLVFWQNEAGVEQRLFTGVGNHLYAL